MAGSSTEGEAESTPAKPFSLFELSWQDIPAFVTAIAGLSIALAVARQLGFFSAIDLKLFSLFSVQDILSNSLSTIPLALFGWVGGSLWALASKPSTSAPPRILRFIFLSKDPAGEVKNGLVFSAVFLVFFAYWPAMLFFQTLIVFIPAAAMWVRMRGVGRLASELVYWLMMLVLLYLGGRMEGQAELVGKILNYELTTTKPLTVDVRLIRATADAYLVSPAPLEIWVVPRDQVQLLKRKNLAEPSPIISIPSVMRYLGDRFEERMAPLKAALPFHGT